MDSIYIRWKLLAIIRVYDSIVLGLKIHIHDTTKLVLIIVRIFVDNIAYKTVHKQRGKIFHIYSGLVVRSYSFSQTN